MSPGRDFLALIARILLAVVFIVSGYGKIGGFDGTVAAIAGKGIPLPQVAAAITILIELGGGILLVLGWKTRWLGLIFFLWLIPTTALFHDFWAAPPDQHMAQQIHFMKNLAIMGGMLMVYAFGPGRLSIDGDGRGRET